MYVSSPVKAVAGSFVVSHIDTGTPETIWNAAGDRAGIERDEYDSYFAGTNNAVAIGVSHPVAYANPVALDRLREMWQPFWVPQSYRYLTPEMVRDLREAQDAGPTLANGRAGGVRD